LKKQQLSHKSHSDGPKAQVKEGALDINEEESDHNNEDQGHVEEAHGLHLRECDFVRGNRNRSPVVSLLLTQPAPAKPVETRPFLLMTDQHALPVFGLLHLSGLI
jgi:hypothetical protein